MPKNIVLCCDGTNNEVAGDSTNVLRLYRILARNSNQIAFYDSGVGTIPNSDRISATGRLLGAYLDSAIGLSIRFHFINAYRFLVRHYEHGDQIFIFGFSRGAYTARAVAGAIHMFGILRPELESLCDLLWVTYSQESPASRGGAVFQGGATFKKAFGVKGRLNPNIERDDQTDVPIHCVGVWDTVSAFGLIWDMRTLPFTDFNPSIHHVRHAMAVDEHRAMFQVLPFRPRELDDHQSIKQVWFAGVHSDVGGGYPDGTSKLPDQFRHATLSKVSLNWMLNEVGQLGLLIDPVQQTHLLNNPPRHPPADPFGMQHESLTCGWCPLELLPQRRFFKRRDKGSPLAWYAPNFWRRRNIRELSKTVLGERPLVHQSVFDRWEHGSVQGPYRPSNLPPRSDCDIEP